MCVVTSWRVHVIARETETLQCNKKLFEWVLTLEMRNGSGLGSSFIETKHLTVAPKKVCLRITRLL